MSELYYVHEPKKTFEFSSLAPCAFKAEWYCPNEDCAVRRVHIHVDEPPPDSPPRMKCPACRKDMKVHAFNGLYPELVRVACALESKVPVSISGVIPGIARRPCEMCGKTLLVTPGTLARVAGVPHELL